MNPRHEISLARQYNKEPQSQEPTALEFGILKRIFSYTKPYAAKRNWLFAIVIIRGIQLPLLAWAIGAIIDGPISSGDPQAVLLATIGFALLALLTQVTMHYRQLFAFELGEFVVRDLRSLVYRKLMTLPMSYYNRTKFGRIISRMTSDIESMRTGVQNVFFVSLVQGAQMIVTGIFMLYYNWVLFSVIVIMVPFLWYLNRYFQKRISEASRNVQESFSRVIATLAESVKGIRVTQSFVREEVNAGIFRRLVTDHSRFNITKAQNNAIYIPLLELNSQFFIASILLIGGYGVLSPVWPMQVGDLIIFFFLANLFFSPISSLGKQFADGLSAMAGAERVFRLLDAEPEWQDAPDAKTLPPIKGKVEFMDVRFSYEPGKPVLHGISFVAEPGQMVALVGHTGSGKSSIINLISKFYLPDSGQILIDDHDLMQITSDSLHKQMGLVLQQNYLFSGTVMENIRLGRLDATDDEVIEAVRSLNILDLVESLPEGFHTEVSERGSGLSMGQQQLVCFARAFLANPRILILDEATSSADTITESRLQEALATLMQNRTSFVVAHRLSTIRKADQVLVLDSGNIAERGSHTELLEHNGIYANLYRQFIESNDS